MATLNGVNFILNCATHHVVHCSLTQLHPKSPGGLDAYCAIDSRPNSGAQICIGFDAPWSPPIGVMEKLRERFSDVYLIMVYAEIGAWFAGELVGSDGVLIINAASEDEVHAFCTDHFGMEFEEDEGSDRSMTK